MSKKNELDYLDKALTIRKVKNGFIITPASESYPTEEINVFESFTTLKDFLAEWVINKGEKS